MALVAEKMKVNMLYDSCGPLDIIAKVAWRLRVARQLGGNGFERNALLGIHWIWFPWIYANVNIILRRIKSGTHVGRRSDNTMFAIHSVTKQSVVFFMESLIFCRYNSSLPCKAEILTWHYKTSFIVTLKMAHNISMETRITLQITQYSSTEVECLFDNNKQTRVIILHYMTL